MPCHDRIWCISAMPHPSVPCAYDHAMPNISTPCRAKNLVVNLIVNLIQNLIQNLIENLVVNLVGENVKSLHPHSDKVFERLGS